MKNDKSLIARPKSVMVIVVCNILMATLIIVSTAGLWFAGTSLVLLLIPVIIVVEIIFIIINIKYLKGHKQSAYNLLFIILLQFLLSPILFDSEFIMFYVLYAVIVSIFVYNSTKHAYYNQKYIK